MVCVCVRPVGSVYPLSFGQNRTPQWPLSRVSRLCRLGAAFTAKALWAGRQGSRSDSRRKTPAVRRSAGVPPASESPGAFVYLRSFTHSVASKSSGCLFSPFFPPEVLFPRQCAAMLGQGHSALVSSSIFFGFIFRVWCKNIQEMQLFLLKKMIYNYFKKSFPCRNIWNLCPYRRESQTRFFWCFSLVFIF